MAGQQGSQVAALHDVDLATRAALGDRRAFGELVRRHGSAVRGLLRRMGANPAEADDTAQDAFLAAFENIADYRGQGAFHAWVKKIAARQYLRKLQRDRRLAGLAIEAEVGEPTSNIPDAINRLDLDEALKGLIPVERLCVSLCYGAGLSHAEAAEALNLPLGTVKSHVKRGLDRLRARLAPESGTGRQDHG